MEFVKIHGLGNDFILFSLLEKEVHLSSSEIRFLCQRRFGIGADGIIFILPPEKEGSHFQMKIFNTDGSEASMCGNGIRCMGHYIYTRGLSTAKELFIETRAGLMKLVRKGDSIYTVNMGSPSFEPGDIPVLAKGKVMEEELEVGGHSFTISSLKMGNPHTVLFVKDAEEIPLEEYGPLIENAPLFPEKTNVEFVSIISPKELRMRVWERGVGVTKACGSGATAAAIAAIVTKRTENIVKVHLDGGELIISWEEGADAFMTGPAQTVYGGVVDDDFLKRGCE